MPGRRGRRTDTNHAEIVRVLRAVGFYVWDASHVGGGFPDLVVARHGVLRLVEVKDGRKPPSARTLTADEQAVHAAFLRHGVAVDVVASEAEALAL